MKYSYLLTLLIVFVSCVKVQPRRPIDPKPSTTIYLETAKEYKALNQAEDARILSLIQKDTLQEYLQSSNGFWYTYNLKINDSLVQPKKGNTVTLEYNILSLNDSTIYSAEELGIKEYKVDEEDFISGLQKGIKLMKTGETITFVIPSYNAFGIAGDGNKVGMNQTIKSKVTLINIK